MKLLWILVNCNTQKEARMIGDAALNARLAACYEIFPRLLTRYFWPPRQRRIKSGKGCLLVLETLPKYMKRIETMVKQFHRDTLPFIGSITIENVRPEYLAWLRGELKE